MSDLFELRRSAEPKAAVRHKVFFALCPEPDAAEEAHRIARSRRRTGDWLTPRERLHVSLNHVASTSEISPEVLARARAAAEAIAVQPFVIAFNRLATWGGRPGDRAVVLWGDGGVAGAVALHDALQETLAAAGVVRPVRTAFEPHLTLLRKAQDTPPEFVPTVRWPVRELVLIDSVHGAGRHEILGRWSLGH